MKKISVLILLAICMAATTKAQKPASAIFAEIGGPGLASFNYDMRFNKSEKGLGFRVGVGGYSDSDIGLFTVPVGLNYLLGKDDKNYFELGVGFTYVNVKEKYFDPYYDDNGRFEGSFGHLNFGYRMAPKKGGFFFRAAINPVFSSEGFFPLYGGIGFGYKF